MIRPAAASLEEVKYYLRLCRDLAYVSESLTTTLAAQADDVGRLLERVRMTLATVEGNGAQVAKREADDSTVAIDLNSRVRCHDQ